MTDHICTVCFVSFQYHAEVCYEGEDPEDREARHIHVPALCCPGCDCRSFEQAHPTAVVEAFE